jgi:hypothetical protein
VSLPKEDRSSNVEKDLGRKQKEIKRRQRKEREDAETASAAEALMKKMNDADTVRKERDDKVRKQEDDLSSKLTEVKKETKKEDEESDISSIDSAELAVLADQVANNKELQEEYERLTKAATKAVDNEVDADDKEYDDWEAKMVEEVEKGLRED